ncbi:MAG TPA: hypothetical protein VIX13_02985 [Candidatus Eisenbacteria bacterium]
MMVVIVAQLKAYVDGNEDALLELTEVLDSGRFDAEVVNRAFEMIFRALEPYAREDYVPEATKERSSVRVPTGPERALLLTNPAFGYLFGLLETGKVTPEQFEEILVRAKEMGSSLDSEIQAKELATDVLIRWFDDENGVSSDPASSAWVH